MTGASDSDPPSPASDDSRDPRIEEKWRKLGPLGAREQRIERRLLRKWLDPALTRKDDRKLFGLYSSEPMPRDLQKCAGKSRLIAMRHGFCRSLGSMLLACACAIAHAANTDAEPDARIVVSGTGVVRSAATQAAFTIGITTGAASAAAASGDDARLAKAVTEGLYRANLPQGAIRSSTLRVHPKWQYDEGNRRSRPAGYEATTTIRVEVSDLEHIGNYLDAALTAGATDVSEVHFSVQDAETPPRQALALAVSHARADAQALAQAAGGTLGDLLDLRTQLNDVRPGVMEEVVVSAARRARETVDTAIVPDEIRTTATVIAAWRFAPGAARTP